MQKVLRRYSKSLLFTLFSLQHLQVHFHQINIFLFQDSFKMLLICRYGDQRYPNRSYFRNMATFQTIPFPFPRNFPIMATTVDRRLNDI